MNAKAKFSVSGPIRHQITLCDTMELPIFVINLNRRPDRMAGLRAQLDNLGLAMQRVAAIDGSDGSFADLSRACARTGPLGRIGENMIACGLSHARAWSRFLAGNSDAVLILEDDVELSPRLPTFLQAFATMRPKPELVKLDRAKNERGVFVDKTGAELAGCELRRLHSLHSCAAAYLISRRGARIALSKFATIDVPPDHFLFNPGRGTAFAELNPIQLFPALARQSVAVGGASDIVMVAPRKSPRLAYHLRRTAHEMRPFLKVLARWCTGSVSLRRVKFHTDA